MIVVGRFRGDTTLNGKEYLLDKEGAMIGFKSEEEAKEALVEWGIKEEILDAFLYEEVQPKVCPTCNEEALYIEDEIQRDKLGDYFICKICDKTFDAEWI